MEIPGCIDCIKKAFWLSEIQLLPVEKIIFFQLLCNPIWIFFDSSDLDNFKSQAVRKAVNVREGQGVVLLCGPPVNSGGELLYLSSR